MQRFIIAMAAAWLAVSPLLALIPASPARAASWLDGPIGDSAANWNKLGMDVPTAPEAVDPINRMCPPIPDAALATPEEQAVAAAGWKRVKTEASWWGLTLVYGQQNVDGMSRPMTFQYFVFSNGKLAGTVSPEPMDSRTDSSGSIEALRHSGIDAHYSRYKESDPLCCPSGTVTIRFEIERSDAGAVLTPKGAI